MDFGIKKKFMKTPVKNGCKLKVFKNYFIISYK